MTSARLPRDWTPPIARRQSGLFTIGQALAAGISPATARGRRRSGLWQRVAGDAFTLAGREVDLWLRVQAAGLTWPDAVVCLAAAAVVHRIPVSEPREIDVIVRRRAPSRHGLTTHRVEVPTAEVVRVGLAQVTSVRRTVADCIGRLDPVSADGVLAWAVTRRLIDLESLAADSASRPRTWGTTRRRAALALLASGAASVAESRLHDLLVRNGLRGWSPNAPVRDHSGRILAAADVLFEAERVVVEVDGQAWHGAARAARDLARQNALAAAGYTVVRLTWADLTERPAATVALLRRVLRARQAAANRAVGSRSGTEVVIL